MTKEPKKKTKEPFLSQRAKDGIGIIIAVILALATLCVLACAVSSVETNNEVKRKCVEQGRDFVDGNCVKGAEK